MLDLDSVSPNYRSQPKHKHTIPNFPVTIPKMSSQEQPAKCQQLNTHTGGKDETPSDTISLGISTRWKQTPMGRWEREKVEEQPWNALAAVNIDPRWRESLGTQDTCSTKGETGSAGGETKEEP
ncbi:hypothetical protein N431DRAFT_109864 [Stipitochalara longipes BDJ]|nr:hypothetical protein N431DRAFT_109864 [Stipitochalara longipes BDJ]